MATKPPVLLLAFSDDNNEHLSFLEKEREAIGHIFGEANLRGDISVLPLPNAGLEDLRKSLLEHREALTIFHYGGHAGGKALRLEDGSGHAGGLAKMLGEKTKELKLVFLNGCATHDHVNQLLGAGVKAVIATKVSIGDEAAFDFSKSFYESFAKGNNLEQCYRDACHFLEFKYKDALPHRFLKHSARGGSPTSSEGEEPAWALFYNDENTLHYRGFNKEPDKVFEQRFINRIQSLREKIPVRILIAASSVEKLPNGKISPANVHNEVALIREFVNKLFVYSRFSQHFEPDVYQLLSPTSAMQLIAAGEREPATAPQPLPKLENFQLVIWVIWNNLGEASPTKTPPLEWLYAEALQLPETKRPTLQIYRRSEWVKSYRNEANEETKAEQTKSVRNFFRNKTQTRVVDYRPDLFEDEFEHHLRGWLRKYVMEGSFKTLPDAVTQLKDDFHNPYKGLEPYSVEDRNLFFGRINDVDILRDRISESGSRGWLAVVGASGSGKSSLVRAGLFNRLQLDAVPGSQSWAIIECSIEQDNSFRFFDLKNEGNDLSALQSLFPELLKKGARGTPEFAKLIAVEQRKIVLFIDQFEEAFTLLDDEDCRKAFFEFLVNFTDSGQHIVIVTLRSEFYHRFLDYREIAAHMEAGHSVLLPPGKESIRQIIERPATFSGLKFEEGLTADIHKDAGAEKNALPLLSYLLEQLVLEREGILLTRSAYERLGGVAGIIQQQAQEATSNFEINSNQFKQDFSFVFRKLVSVGHDGIAAKRPAVFDRSAFSNGALQLVDELAKKRLLITDADELNRGTLEIAHEALLRHWDLLAAWILEVKSSLLLLTKVEAEAKDWQLDRTAFSENEIELLKFDNSRLWVQERLDPVNEAISLLGLNKDELKDLYPNIEQFIRPEYDRLLEEINKPFVEHQRRAQIGDRLASLGDRRPGVGLRDGLPDIVWCKVPPGEVFIKDLNQTFQIPEPLYFSKYPVTLAQFNAFAKCKDDYNDTSWWDGLPVKPWTHQPYPQTPENMDNRPAEFVTWYQALAFCRWLSARLGYQIRMPFEWEWQHAASGGIAANEYPWGNVWNAALSINSETVGTLAAVGLFPLGATRNDKLGIMDLAGNVVEWCQNVFDDVFSEDLGENVKRVTKGGSWAKIVDAKEWLKVTHRLGDFPHGVNPNGNRIRAGFRLVCHKTP